MCILCVFKIYDYLNKFSSQREWWWELKILIFDYYFFSVWHFLVWSYDWVKCRQCNRKWCSAENWTFRIICRSCFRFMSAFFWNFPLSSMLHFCHLVSTAFSTKACPSHCQLTWIFSLLALLFHILHAQFIYVLCPKCDHIKFLTISLTSTWLRIDHLAFTWIVNIISLYLSSSAFAYKTFWCVKFSFHVSPIKMVLIKLQAIFARYLLMT